MTRKSLCLIVMALAVCIIFSTGRDALAQKKFLSIGTCSTSGAYYPLGGALAQAISLKLADVVATAQTTTCSVMNINLIRNKEVETGLTQNNQNYWAYHATEMFEGQPPYKGIRVIATLFPEQCMLVATKKSGIKSYRELKGRRYSGPDKGSGSMYDAMMVFKVLGLTVKDFASVDYLPVAGTAQRLKDDQGDFTHWTGGAPLSGLMDLFTTTPSILISMDDELIKKVCAAYPYYTPAVIEKGTYPTQDYDVKTVQIWAQWTCDESFPADLVYRLTKALWEKGPIPRREDKLSCADIMAQVHIKGKLVQWSTAIYGTGVPFHPGAEKYYKEKGLIK
jgi:TRAP transporter TAXI family solute receptor